MNLQQLLMLVYGFVVLFSTFGTCAKGSMNGSRLTLNPIARALGVILPVVFFLLISFRSQQFGVDTQAYADIYESYCLGQFERNLGFDFYLASILLDIGMFGACKVSLIPASWIMVVGVLSLLASLQNWRYGYISLLFFSLIGFEFSTNALRQGFSVAFLLCGISFFLRNSLFLRSLGILLSFVSVALHSSSALVILALLLSLFPWKIFLPMFFTFIWLIVSGGLQIFIGFPGVSRFLYEIEKYSMHGPDEIWIRILVLTSFVSTLITPLLCRLDGVRIKNILSDPSYSFVCRLFVIVLPSMALPYFGYRFGYSIYAFLLYFIMHSVGRGSVSNARLFLFLFLFNGLVLFAWSSTSLIKSVSFF